MALTLQLVSDSLTLQSSSLTVFSPSDNIFVGSGQQSLSLLQFPSFSLPTPSNLSPGTKIPTFPYNHSLTVTSSPSDGDQVSLNGVKINGSLIYDDGSLIIFGIDNFFDSDFENLGPVRKPNRGVQCAESVNSKSGLKDAVAASRLERLQLYGFVSRFVVDGSWGHPSIFMSHIVPCQISWII